MSDADSGFLFCIKEKHTSKANPRKTFRIFLEWSELTQVKPSMNIIQIRGSMSNQSKEKVRRDAFSIQTYYKIKVRMPNVKKILLAQKK